MPIRRNFLIERRTVTEHDGIRRTLHFCVQPGSRSRPWRWFAPDEVPEFEGDEAWFECERDGRRWKVLRRLDQS